jgi:hypothetical protein
MRAQRPYIYDAGYSLPGPRLIRAGTLNYRTAAADMVWIGGVQFVAKSMVVQHNADAVTDYARAVIALDPYFYKVYSWHSAARMLAVGYPHPEDIKAANDVLEVGMHRFPDDWRLPYEAVANYIGFNLYTDTETRIQQVKRGIEFAEEAASRPGSPEIMIKLAIDFRQKLRRLKNEIAGKPESVEPEPEIDQEMLIRLYVLSSDKLTRKSILNRLRRANGTDRLAARLQEYEQRRQNWYATSAMNYLPFGLFTLVNEGAPLRVDHSNIVHEVIR